jgi:hypothetical protein
MKTAVSEGPKFCQQAHHKHQKPYFEKQKAHSNSTHNSANAKFLLSKTTQNDYTKTRSYSSQKASFPQADLMKEENYQKFCEMEKFMRIKKFCVKSPKFAGSEKKRALDSKVSRKKRLLLRMEIFGGTYMRLW